MSDRTDERRNFSRLLREAAEEWLIAFRSESNTLNEDQKQLLRPFGDVQEKVALIPISAVGYSKLIELLKTYDKRFNRTAYNASGASQTDLEDTPFRLAAAVSEMEITTGSSGFELVLDQLVDYIFEDEAEIVLTAELYGFHTSLSEAAVGSRVHIVPNDAVRGLSWYGGIPSRPPSHMLKTSVRLPVSFDGPDDALDVGAERLYAARLEIERVSQALRIHKSGVLVVGRIWESATNWVMRFGKTSIGSAPSGPSGMENYEFTESDISPVGRIVELLRDVATTGPRHLGVAARRFSLALTRINPEDQLIDLMISAEALFLNDMSGELSFRLATRASTFLRTDRAERLEVFQSFRKAYDARSKLVHGDYVELSSTLSEVAQSESLMRESVLKALGFIADKSPSTITKWDDLAFLDI